MVTWTIMFNIIIRTNMYFTITAVHEYSCLLFEEKKKKTRLSDLLIIRHQESSHNDSLQLNSFIQLTVPVLVNPQ